MAPPAPRPVVTHHVQTCASTGVRLAVHEFPAVRTAASPGAGGGDAWEPAEADACAVFVHGAGFHGRCWDQVVAALPPRTRCLCVDQSDKPPPSLTPDPYDWMTIGNDLVVLLRALAVRGALGIGHSGGGYAVAHVAVYAPEVFGGLLLLDPVLCPPHLYKGDATELYAPVVKAVTQRRARFRSPQEMLARYRQRPNFQTWQPQVLADYCLHGLVDTRPPSEDGGWPWSCTGSRNAAAAQRLGASDAPAAAAVASTRSAPAAAALTPSASASGAREVLPYALACPPTVEATWYMNVYRHPLHSRLPSVRVPACVIRAARAFGGVPLGQPDLASSPTDPELWRAFGLPARDCTLPETYSHFFPMEDPALIAKEALQLLEQMRIPRARL